MSQERKPIEQRLTSIEAEAESWKPAWKEIKKYIKPTRGHFDNEKPNEGKTIDHKTLIDGTPIRAARILAAGMTSGLTSPSRPWFRLGLSDTELEKFEPVKYWLADSAQRLMAAFERSNIYTTLYNAYEENGVFGVSASMVLEDFDDIMRGRSFTCGEFFLGNDFSGRVDTFGRRYQMTVGQLVKQFGIDKVEPHTRRLFENGKVDEWVKVNHLICPNDDRKSGYVDNQNMPWLSATWEDGGTKDAFLRFSGFEEFPVQGARWDLVTSSDIYGRSPGWDALGDSKMLQKEQKDKLIGISKVVDPPMQVDANVPGRVNTMPGGVTRSSAQTPDSGAKPAYQIRPDLAAILTDIQAAQKHIFETFYADMFLMMVLDPRQQPATAREIAERHEEKLLMLGPVLNRLESELLDPIINRAFNIMLRAGLLAEIPEELQGMSLKIEYISLLAQAQKMVGTAAIREHMSFTGELAQVLPAALDVVNPDVAVREHGDMLGIPPGINLSPEDVAANREQKAKAAQQEQQVVMAQEAAKTAKTLSDTKLDEGSALDALTGQGDDSGQNI